MTLGVGLVGANPDRGWGRAVHMPALDRVDGARVVAVSTTRLETARRSAEQCGASGAYDSAEALVEDPAVDVVVVAVRAPAHHEIIGAAIEAGKHVYCEWPLVTTVDHAIEVERAARHAGVHAMVGLQARGSRVLRELRARVAHGAVGRPISAHVSAVLPGGGRRRSAEGMYVIDRAHGASVVDIHGGHALDALRFCLGDIASISGSIATRFDEVELIETGEIHRKTAPDQLVAAGTTVDGVPFTASVTGGAVAGFGVSLEVRGDRGALRAVSPGRLNLQMADLCLEQAVSGDASFVLVDLGEGSATAGEAASPYPGVQVPAATVDNVVQMYQDLIGAIAADESVGPSFAEGRTLHQLLGSLAGPPTHEHKE